MADPNPVPSTATDRGRGWRVSTGGNGSQTVLRPRLTTSSVLLWIGFAVVVSGGGAVLLVLTLRRHAELGSWVDPSASGKASFLPFGLFLSILLLAAGIVGVLLGVLRGGPSVTLRPVEIVLRVRYGAVGRDGHGSKAGTVTVPWSAVGEVEVFGGDLDPILRVGLRPGCTARAGDGTVTTIPTSDVNTHDPAGLGRVLSHLLAAPADRDLLGSAAGTSLVERILAA